MAVFGLYPLVIVGADLNRCLGGHSLLSVEGGLKKICAFYAIWSFTNDLFHRGKIPFRNRFGAR